jgi:mono/diheme cytochrome c family protein
MMRTHWTRLLFLALVTSIYLGHAVATFGGAAAPPDGWQIPAGAAAESNPEPVNASVLAKGQALYKAKCQRCHGADGSGHGPEADREHPAGDLSDGHAAARNPDGVMFYKIWNGRTKPKMPAMKMDLMRSDVWTLIQYVKTLRK